MQLYEASAYLLIAALLWTVVPPPRLAAPAACWPGCFADGVCRPRAAGNPENPQAAYETSFAVSVGQWLSLPLMALGLWLVWRIKRRA